MRVIDSSHFDEPRKVRHRIHCTICGKSTRGGKPFCSKHLDKNPYIQQMKQQNGYKYALQEK